MLESSVKPKVLALLKKFMNWTELHAFSLGGGTALALQFGHRESTDKDFSDLLLLHENGTPLLNSVLNFAGKYGEEGLFGAIRSLNYFDDTKDEPDPHYLNGWTWNHVRNTMTALCKELPNLLNKTLGRKSKNRDNEGLEC